MKRNKILKYVAYTFLVILILTFAYKLFFHHQDVYEVGLARNLFTGETYLLDKPGFYRNYPWVWVAIAETRPTRVCVTSTARSYNCKLAQFKPEHYQEFLETEGWRFYWLSNRISINFGYDDEYRGFKDILRGYAFGNKKYNFIEVSDSP